MPTEEAMEKYVEIVIRLYPDWGSPSASKTSVSSPIFKSFLPFFSIGNECCITDLLGFTCLLK